MFTHTRLTFSDIVYWCTFLFVVVAVGYLLVSLISLGSPEDSQYNNSSYLKKQSHTAIIETSYGTIRINFLRSQAPIAVANFAQLAQSGFYDKTKFHRVLKGKLIEGGDPLSREKDKELYGTGGPGYVFEDEIRGIPMERGVVAMSNLGRPRTNGSRFFIQTADTAPLMEGKYTVFGRVTQGMGVVDAISAVETDADDIPVVPVVVDSITVE